MLLNLALAFVLCITVTSAVPQREGMVNLDIDKYSGTWYLIEFGPVSDPDNSLPCLQESYARKADNPFLGDMHWSGGSALDGTKQDLDGVTAFADQAGGNPWTLYLDGARLETHILSTDYTTWAIEYSFGAVNSTLFERVMIRSRTTSLDASLLSVLHTFISGMGFDYRFKTVDHSNCQ